MLGGHARPYVTGGERDLALDSHVSQLCQSRGVVECNCACHGGVNESDSCRTDVFVLGEGWRRLGLPKKRRGGSVVEAKDTGHPARRRGPARHGGSSSAGEKDKEKGREDGRG